MKYILAVLTILVLGGIAGLIFIFSGVYNMSATSPHNALTLRVIDLTLENSVKRHARDIVASDLTGKDMIESGHKHYNTMCVGCHGAPGIEISEIAQGLYPRPPDLAEEAEEWTEPELFWITKNGLKMTGMPAFGHSHSDEEVWSIVAFLKALPEMSAEEYRRMGREIIEIEPEEVPDTTGQNHEH